jgi:RCC1 and BTB domain-containing protein
MVSKATPARGITNMPIKSGGLTNCGLTKTGKLGHGNENGHSTPKRVEALVGLVVSMIACGSRHTAVVTSPEGNLYTW